MIKTNMVWHNSTEKDVEKSLETNITKGLSKDEAESRLFTYGENRLEGQKKVSPIAIFVRQFADFMVMVLLGAAAVSALMGESLDAIMIVAIVILNSILGFVQEYRAEKSLDSLKEMASPMAKVIRNDEHHKIPASDVVIGDVVVLDQGAKVPCDIRLTEAINLSAEESALTGESMSVNKSCDVVDSNAPLGSRNNMCYGGTLISSGRGMGIVVATGMDTEVGKIAHLLDHADSGATPLQKRLKSLGKWLIVICLSVCVALVIAGIKAGADVFLMLLTGVSLAVASIPEGLPAIVTISLALGVWRMAKRNAIIRRLPASESLGCTTVICSDKTGTLTMNSMVAEKIYYDGKIVDVDDFTCTNRYERLMMEICGNCHNIVVEDNAIAGDPTEKALLALAMKCGQRKLHTMNRINEISFDSDRKRMSVLVEGGTSLVKGAPDVLLPMCSRYVYQGESRVLDDASVKKILLKNNRLAGEGYRIIALAYKDNATNNDMEDKLTFLSLVAIADPLRPDALNAVKKCRNAGIRVIMITGDHPKTALSIGKKLGLVHDDESILTGAELDKLSDKELSVRVNKVSIYARVTPEHKLKIVRTLKGLGEVVAMTGDGVNDAPAIKEADIGISMGKTGTDVTKEASDMILADDNFATIVHAIEGGRGIYDNIRKFIRYLLASNIGEVLVMFMAVLLVLPMPLLPLQILWINLVTDGLPALAIGLDKPSPRLMQEKPRKSDEGVFAHGLGAMILGRGVLIGLSTLGVYVYVLLTHDGDMALARTVAFTTLVMCQLFFVFNCRSEHETVFKLGIFSNIYLVGAVILSVVMQCMVVYMPFMQVLFNTVSINLSHWSLILVVSGTPTLLAFVKYLIYKK